MTKKIEILVFSKTQSNLIELDETGLLLRRFYKGIEFTDRFDVNVKSPFDDAEIVFTGEINDSDIKYGKIWESFLFTK